MTLLDKSLNFSLELVANFSVMAFHLEVFTPPAEFGYHCICLASWQRWNVIGVKNFTQNFLSMNIEGCEVIQWTPTIFESRHIPHEKEVVASALLMR